MTKVNGGITSDKVRLVDQDGEMLGVVDIKDALRKAQEAGLDLVAIAENAEPPVCKILDYGKYKYEVQKRKNLAKKKQKVISNKEIKMRPNIEEHDFQVKLKRIKEFLAKGDKVKISIRFRGREMMYQELGAKVLERIQADIEEIAKVESRPKMEGRQLTMFLAPKSAKA